MKKTLSKKEYLKIYYKDYYKLRTSGIIFKFKTIKDGWCKKYYKDGMYLGYRYYDSKVYKKQILIDTFRGEGYDDLIKVLSKFISYNSVKFNINNYFPADIYQLQCEVILRKVKSFDPTRNNKIHTFMCRCLKNELINESRKQSTLSRFPRVAGNKKHFAKIHSLDANDFLYEVIPGRNCVSDRNRIKDFERAISRHRDEVGVRLIRKIYYDDYSISKAARAEKISIREASEKIKAFKNNKELLDLLRSS